jgi:hypothetical protein
MVDNASSITACPQSSAACIEVTAVSQAVADISCKRAGIGVIDAVEDSTTAGCSECRLVDPAGYS